MASAVVAGANLCLRQAERVCAIDSALIENSAGDCDRRRTFCATVVVTGTQWLEVTE
ncbi:hypothetical protein PA08_1076 [Cutibacterium modestum P08]|nr:hypothetical protein PA08_1076 [Cutibacterium modestum P08]